MSIYIYRVDLHSFIYIIPPKNNNLIIYPIDSRYAMRTVQYVPVITLFVFHAIQLDFSFAWDAEP